MKRGKQLERKTPLRPGGTLNRRKPMKQGSGFAASRAQREKVKGMACACVVCGRDRYYTIIDPAHVAARAHGGCDEPTCVVPLCRTCHDKFDDGALDLLPHLVPRYTAEIAHAVEHYNGDLIALLQRLTGQRYEVVE